MNNAKDLTTAEKNFIAYFEVIAEAAKNNSASKGFWDNPRNKGEMIALMHSELSEALEGVRKPTLKSDKLPDFSIEEEELADAIIRIMDYASGFNLRVGEAVIRKMHYNAGRERMHGGKAF
jgi:NTP pyrophosphatase (non-canonical NTP hydrolase)